MEILAVSFGVILSMQIFIVKAIYFLLYAAFSSWLSFFYIYLKDYPSLSGVEIGAIAAVQQFSSLFVVPIWGVLADKYGRKRMFSLSLLLSAFGLLAFVYQGEFLFYFIFMIAFTLIYNPLTSLVDSIALDLEEQNPKDTSYGQLRLWASIGWAVSTVATGYFVQWAGIEQIFVLASVLLFITLGVVVILYKPIPQSHLPESINFSVMTDLLKGSKELCLFLALIMVFTLFSSPIHLFINLYFNEINATPQQIGWAFALQSISELPFFFYGNKLIRKFGIRSVLSFAMATTAIRMFAYSFVTDAIIASIIGVSHGICLALYLIAMVAFIHRIVPSHLKSTGQSLMYAAFALGICLGNLLTGHIKDIASISTAMYIFSYISLLLAGMVFFVKPRKFSN